MRIINFFCVLFTAFFATAVSAEEYSQDIGHVTSRIQIEHLDGKSLGAAAQTPRSLSALALAIIKDFEQWRPTAYNDASDFCTIGYGHLIAKKTCSNSQSELKQFHQPMSLNDGIVLLNKDTGYASIAIQGLVRRQLSDDQFGALTSFVFNVGGDNFSRSTMLRYINNGEFSGAAKEFSKWIKSDGQILDGLITRRACESLLFQSKLNVGADGKFHRENCGSSGIAVQVDNLIDVKLGEK